MRPIAFTLVALTLAGCARKDMGGPRIDPALASMIPLDTTALAGVRMEAVRATAAYQKLVAPRKLEPLDKFAADTGLDPRKDLWEFLAVSNGRDGAVMARGKFSPEDGFEPRLGRAGAKRTPYKGYTLIGDDRAAVAFLNPSTAVAGPPASVRGVLDQRDRSRGVPAALAAKLKTIPAESQAWAVWAGGFEGLRLPPNLTGVLGMVQGGTLAVDLRTGVRAVVTGECAAEPDAKRLNDALRGLIGFGRLSTPDHRPDLLRFYDGIEVKQEQRVVRLTLSVPLDLLESLANTR